MRTTETIYNKMEKQFGFSCTVEDGWLILNAPGCRVQEKVSPEMQDGVYMIMLDELYRIGDLGESGVESMEPGEVLSEVRLSGEDMKVLLKSMPAYINKNHLNNALKCANYRDGVLAATDSYILRMYKSSCSEKAEFNIPILSAVGLLAEGVTVRVYRSGLEFDYGDYKVWLRGEDARYPMYENVIPTFDLPAAFYLDTKEFKNGILPYAKKGDVPAVHINFDKIIVDGMGIIVQRSWPLKRSIAIPDRAPDGLIMPIRVQLSEAEEDKALAERMESYKIEISANAELLAKILTGSKGAIFAYEETNRAMLFWLC